MLGGMRLLILGGTVFLGTEVAAQAVRAGHDVLCAARGESGAIPEGAGFARVDRTVDGGLAALPGDFDAVIDVARRPSFVRRAVRELADRAGHWVFVSSISAYADTATPGQRADTARLHDPSDPHGDELDPKTYGPRKVTCEQILVDAVGPQRSFLCRAGLIVGPHDTTGRFDYWVERLHRGGEILAPGAPTDPVQWIDVRDLATWLIDAAQQRISGPYDGIGPAVTRADLLAGIAEGVGVRPRLTWASQEFLIEQQVEPWFGPRSLPMWLPLPEYAGTLAVDAAPSLAAGLRQRPLAQTAADTLAWLQADGERPARPCGLTEAQESELLATLRG
jgi:2'-hydroxyisoflavone reductase